MKKYSVKEIFLTMQGEGFHSGRTAIFCRFSGCNLWSGLEKDRASAVCKFCDTDFVGTDGENGGKYLVDELVDVIEDLFPGQEERFVVFTGGEPMLQLDHELVSELRNRKFEVAVETNGTIQIPFYINWVCMSPKAGSIPILSNGNELKIVYPQYGIDLDVFGKLNFEHYYLQPMWGDSYEESLQMCVSYCLENPKWKLSFQTHKFIGVD